MAQYTKVIVGNLVHYVHNSNTKMLGKDLHQRRLLEMSDYVINTFTQTIIKNRSSIEDLFDKLLS